MKQKIDFITNSSSASFIISAKKSASLEVPMVIKVELSDYVRETLLTVNDLDKYWKDEYGRDEEDETYEKCKEMIESGEVVYIIRCSSEEGGIEQLLCDEGLGKIVTSPNITIIQGEGGY